MTKGGKGRAVVPVGAAGVARRPPTALAKASRLPVYVTKEEARAIINATTLFRDRLLLEAIWQTGGRISEVLRLRPAHVNVADGSLMLANLKQRGKGNREKVVWVSPDLCAQLRALARDLRIPGDGYLFSAKANGRVPLSR